MATNFGYSLFFLAIHLFSYLGLWVLKYSSFFITLVLLDEFIKKKFAKKFRNQGLNPDHLLNYQPL